MSLSPLFMISAWNREISALPSDSELPWLRPIVTRSN
jgi:hypothetical protein